MRGGMSGELAPDGGTSFSNRRGADAADLGDAGGRVAGASIDDDGTQRVAELVDEVRLRARVCCRTSRGGLVSGGLHRAQAIVATLLKRIGRRGDFQERSPLRVRRVLRYRGKQEWLRCDGNRIFGVRKEQYIVTRCILPLQGEWYDARARN